MKKVSAIILAAGKGKRMKSALPKVAHAALGRPLVWHVAAAARKAGIQDMVFVLGFGRGKVLPVVEGFSGRVAIQENQFGTGDAARCGLKELPKEAKEVVVLCGDAPLLRSSTIRALVTARRRKGAVASVLTGILQEPRGYGRIVRNPDGTVARIVEEKDADETVRRIQEVNSGTYAFDRDFLEAGLPRLTDRNAQREFYLTDLVLEALAKGERVVPLTLDDPDEVRGINSRRELAEASRILRLRKLEELFDAGVTIVDPDRAYVEAESRIGPDSVLEPAVMVTGRSRVGRGVLVQTGCVVRDSVLEDGVILKPYSVVESSNIKKDAIVGPFAHLRPGSNIGAGACIGNFVEVKTSRIGKGSRAERLSYLGDATIGAEVTVRAGTVTCGCDGGSPRSMVVGDGAVSRADQKTNDGRVARNRSERLKNKGISASPPTKKKGDG